METVIIIVHIVIALAMIGMILLQQGKGADAGASFGAGSSQTVFGSEGGGNFFAKVTAVLATLFFVTSFALTVLAKQQAAIGVDDLGIPAIDSDVPVAEAVESDVPVIESTTESDVPVIETDVPAN